MEVFEMSFSPDLGSPITNTHMRNPRHATGVSGMCAVCTADCVGPCEIGLSAIRGSEAILPFSADTNQFASEKRYPLDFSHFNINGRVFGAIGLPADPYQASYPYADISSTFGAARAVPIKAPFILPAMAKLAWREYFAGAALSGVPVVIGEDVVAKDAGLVVAGHRVVEAPLLAEMVSTYRRYHRDGRGDIVLQANFDDEYHGVLEYAIERLDVRSVELKFGQAAKGIQGMGRVPNIKDALRFKKLGYIVAPDPEDPAVAEAYARGVGPVFEKIGKLPMWTPEELVRRVAELRSLGAERVCFKTGPFDPRDIAAIIGIASEAGVDLVTLDGAGGGTGHSPAKMMNEWGMPTVMLEVVVYRILRELEKSGKPLPPIAMAGGFATEDQIFKGLALGAPYISLIAIGRAAMAAASVGRRVGEALRSGSVPREFAHFGATVEEVFADFRLLKAEYGDEASSIPTGALGLYSYLNRVSVGLKQFMALNRKFALRYISREDIVPLTEISAKATGLATYDQLLDRALVGE
ncbi:MAG: glutamate synthase-related protein [Pseudomonadota bacterium]